MYRELSFKEIVYEFDVDNIEINNDKRYMPENEEAYKKIKTALEIDKEGYNVYLIDDFSKDKLSELISYIDEIFKERKSPKDICYVIYADDKVPKALFLNNGVGNKFKEAFEQIQNSYAECTFEFYNSSINKEKEVILDNIQKKRNNLVSELVDVAKEEGFDIKSTHSGFTFIPLKETKIMTEEEYDDLSKEEKELILIKVGELKSKAKIILEELKDMENNEIDKIKNIMNIYFKTEMQDVLKKYRKMFNSDKEALNYLKYVCNKIEVDLIDNYSMNYDDDEEKINEIIFRYAVNVIVDNSKNKKPPIIFEEDPNISNLVGSMEYENHNGVYTTDISLIKAGDLLKANEGCLILRVNGLLSNPYSYYQLKKVLMSEKVNLDYTRGYLELLSLTGLKPEEIKINEKVILVGDYSTYDLLYSYDEDFKKIFKVRAESKPVLEIEDEIKKAFIKEINNIIANNHIKPLTKEAIKELAKWLSRKSESKKKIYFDDHELNRILMLANNNVKNESRDTIEAKDVIQIAYATELIEEEILKNYKENKMLIDVKGLKVGQINGLSVIDTGYFSFGKPIRITCCCYKGDGNIIDVQKESNLSGSIHSKAINILNGYMSTLNGGYTKLPVDFHLSFEQIYGMIEGDSASVAEVVSMISSLSKIPIKQNIAVTGSINQFGEVQPIGGVNEKIEGFFGICNLLDTVEGKGVLIPISNKDDLVLNEEVEKAITEGKFHIYTMETIRDAAELLMGEGNLTFEDIMYSIEKEIKKYEPKKTRSKKIVEE